MKNRVLSILLALGVLITGSLPALADPAAAPGPLDPRFGIAEGFRRPDIMTDTGAGWERLILPWDQIQPNGAGDFSKLGQTLTKDQIQGELNRGTKVAGLFQFTPSWAARDPQNGQRSVPKNLNLAFDDPNNYFGQFVYNTVKYYSGQINDWVIWNEPEFHPGDPGAGGSFTWLGSDADFAQLMKVGYLAAKKANPNVTVSFAATSYWVDELASPKRPQFYDRVLAIMATDPDAAKNNFYHDVTSLNLYRAPDDVYRVYNVFKGIQKKYGVDKPIWLTETNAMPSDDTTIPCSSQQAQNAFVKTTMNQQAAYAEQAYALAAAAGYQRIEFYQMVDGDTCSQPAVWGVTRDSGSKRPVEDALRTAIQNFSNFTRAQFVPLTRLDTGVCQPSCWPDDPTAYVTNNQIYQVAMDKPGNTRVTALWNGDGSTLRARIPVNGASAVAIDRQGNQTPLQNNQGWWVVDLPAATAYFQLSDTIKDPAGYHFIGGDPLLIVEQGVAPTTPVVAPSTGDPGSVPRDFVFSESPDSQTVNSGDAADFFVTTRGQSGFNDPITYSIASWSTQRFPAIQDGSTLPLATTFLSNNPATPGGIENIHFETAGAAPGIYYITIQMASGDIVKTVDIALVVN